MRDHVAYRGVEADEQEDGYRPPGSASWAERPKRLDTRAAQLGALASKPDHRDMRDIVVRLSFALMAATTTACGADRVTVCGGLEVVGFTRPDTATIKVGASTIAIAGEDYDTCAPKPTRDYAWTVSDSSVVSVAPFDSLYAYILGRRPGRATVTPKYKSNGVAVPSIHVTVVP